MIMIAGSSNIFRVTAVMLAVFALYVLVPAWAQTVDVGGGGAPAAALPISPAASVEASPVVETKEFNSVLFAPDEVSAMHSARAAYERMMAGRGSDGAENEEDFLKKLDLLSKPKISAVDQVSFTYPQFFLSTIAYHSEHDWVVWVNGEKITHNTKNHPLGLQVLAIDGEQVTLKWIPERMDRVADVGGKSADGPVHVDRAERAVMFTLKGNQTFSSYAMRVVEGRVMPITVSLQDATAPVAPAPPKSVNTHTKSEKSNDSPSGLDSLINGSNTLDNKTPSVNK